VTTPTQLQRAAVAHLKTALPGLRTCDLYAGEFSGGELSRGSLVAPAVLVACLGATRGSEHGNGEYDFLCRYSAYCLTRHAGGRNERGMDALELAEGVLAEVEGARFGQTGCSKASVTRLDNLYGAEFDRAGVALWAVTWEQRVRLGADIWAEEGVLPKSLYVGIAPEIGIPHEEDYTLVGDYGDE
jgi:phage gp37-like protein